MLKDFNRILFLDLRPWLLAKEPMVKFKLLLQEMEDVSFNHQPLFDIDWDKAINARQSFYLKLIENAGTSFLNSFQSELKVTKDIREKNYLIHTKLGEIQSFIKEWCSVLGNITSSKDVVFVFDNLQHQLVRLFLEIQESKNGEVLSMDEVYEMLFSISAPNPEKIIDAPVILLSEAETHKAKENKRSFVPVMDDFRAELKGILSFDTIIKNPKRFAEAEMDLYLKGFIGVDYNFTHKHGLKNELATIYHEFIAKGYFNPRDFERLKDIKPRDIRKFLDNRYNVNLDKQFRTSMVNHII